MIRAYDFTAECGDSAVIRRSIVAHGPVQALLIGLRMLPPIHNIGRITCKLRKVAL